jgi:hypothetical protein
MKVNGLIENPKWKRVLVCTCKGKIDECLHCKYTNCESSIPTKDFKIEEPVLDKDGKIIKTITRTIKKINIVNGSHDDVIGWNF